MLTIISSLPRAPVRVGVQIDSLLLRPFSGRLSFEVSRRGDARAGYAWHFRPLPMTIVHVDLLA